jgi:hypothetical protein
MALQLTNPYLANLQGDYSNVPSTNRYGGSSNGLAQLVGRPDTNIGTTARPAPRPTQPKATTAPARVAAVDDSAARAQAARAAQAAADRAALLQQIHAALTGIQSAGETNVRDLTNSYSTNNQSTVNSITDAQTGINQSRANTALNLRRNMADIINGVRQGFTQGRAQLAGMNATDSGAVFDLARGYAGQANTQANTAHNDAFLENQQTDQQQTQLDRQRQEALANFATYRQTEVDRISNSLFSQLQTLSANASANGINGQVDMGLRDRLIDQAIAQLNAVDQHTSVALAGVTAYTPDQATAEAARLYAGGGVGSQSPSRSVV